jgi:thymidylate synthase
LKIKSVDVPVGAPYNIAQYSLLLALLAHCTNLNPGEFIWSTGDTHIYSSQMHLVDEQLDRKPYPAPKLWINPDVRDIYKFTPDDIKILDYQSHPHIPYPVAI